MGKWKDENFIPLSINSGGILLNTGGMIILNTPPYLELMFNVICVALITSFADSLMNCLAESDQMAGTVNTQ